jgi:hypothetical protein
MQNVRGYTEFCVWMAQYWVGAFYIAVTLPDAGRNYWPKHVALNVINKWIYHHLWCYTERKINQQTPIESLSFFVKVYIKLSVLFHWQVGSQFPYEQSSPWETDSRTLTQGILLLARDSQLITALPTAHTVLHCTPSCYGMLTHSSCGYHRVYANSYVFVTNSQGVTDSTFTAEAIVSTDLKKRRNTHLLWPIRRDNMESRKLQLAEP